MQMQMEYGLAGFRIAIHDHAITAIGKILLPGDFTRRRKQTSNNGLVVFLDIINCRNMTLRDDNRVGRRLRIDIAKGQRGSDS